MTTPEAVTTRDFDSAVQRWKRELELADKEEKTWRELAPKIIKRYRDERRRDNDSRRFNILWSNVETLKPAIFSQTPAPDVRRRFLDQDPIGRDAAEIMERALSFSIDDYDFDSVIEQVRDDMLLAGRGVARVTYEAEIDREPLDVVPIFDFDPETGEEFEAGERFMRNGVDTEPDGRDGNGPFVENITDETVRCEYVYWEHFRMSPARTWADVRWIAFKHFMTRDQLKEMWPDKAAQVPLNATVDPAEDSERTKGTDEPDTPFRRAVVWEIWDKTGGEVKWYAEGMTELLESTEPPLTLQGFFPIPEPLYAITTTDTMVPVPEFTIYQDQADELDTLTFRINKLIGAAKVAGIYSARQEETINALAQADDLDLVPAQDWLALADQGGIGRAIEWLPLDQIATVLAGLYRQREQLRQEIFELTGISDLFRGSSSPSETATAQRIKGNFGQLRMTPRQKPMARFVRDVLRLKAEIIAEQFDPTTIARMTGQVITDDVVGIYRDDRLRSFRIDIETDSTVKPDAEREKAEATEFMSAVTAYLQGAVGIAAQAPGTIPMLMEMLKFGVRNFKTGRTLEEVIDQTAEQLQGQAAQLQEQQALATAVPADGAAPGNAQAAGAVPQPQLSVVQ